MSATEIVAVIGAACGGVGTALGALTAYWLARKRMSGKVATTDADALWDEANALRRDYREQNAKLMARIDALEREIEAYRKESVMKDDRIRHLEDENQRLTARVVELEARLEAVKQAGKVLADGGAQ